MDGHHARRGSWHRAVGRPTRARDQDTTCEPVYAIVSTPCVPRSRRWEVPGRVLVGDGLVPSRRALRARFENASHSRGHEPKASQRRGFAGDHNAPATARGRPDEAVDPAASAAREIRRTPASPHFSPVAAMMRALAGAIEDFGSVWTRSLERALATGSLQPGSARGLPLACKSIGASQATRWPTVEVACAHTGPKDRCEGAAQARHSRGQRSL